VKSFRTPAGKAVFFLCSLVLVCVTFGCSSTGAPGTGESPETPTPALEAETPRPGGTLLIQTTSLVQFDPIYVADDNSFHVVSNVFSLLFRSIGSETIPDLATSWEYEGNTSLVFHLRPDVMWQDGNAVFARGSSREVVADDVVYSIRRAVETEGSTIAADLKSSYQSVEAVDRYTVRLKLKSPNALLFTMGRGLSGVAIVPREAVEQLGADFALNPIGSGPFRFVEYRPDESLTLERNDLYWKTPYVDRIVYRIIPDQQAAVIALESGEVDVLASVPSADLPRLSADPRFVLVRRGCPTATQLAFNMSNRMFSQPAFRQAIAYALDGEAVSRNAYGGMHVSGCGTAGPGIPGYDPELCRYFGFDPGRARTLLGEQGWTDSDADGILDKDGQPLRMPIEIWNTPPMPQIGAAVATQLADVGISVDLQTVEFGTFMADWTSGADKAMILGGFCGDGGMNSLWGRQGFARSMGYDDPDIMDLLDSANELVDAAERDRVLREAANLIYSRYWAIPLGFRDTFQASRAWVHDFPGTLWYENLCTERNNVWVSKAAP
jgi:peptide/nickel transport system substrate-binding protein